jgi:hypothetical protein
LNTSFTIPLTAITYPGVYVFSATVTGVGTNTTIVNINTTAGTLPAIWTSSGSTNTTSFSNGGTVTIQTNIGNATALIFYYNSSSATTTVISLPISQPSGSNYNTTYIIPATGPYLIRLDTSTSIGIATTMITVS